MKANYPFKMVISGLVFIFISVSIWVEPSSAKEKSDSALRPTEERSTFPKDTLTSEYQQVLKNILYTFEMFTRPEISFFYNYAAYFSEGCQDKGKALNFYKQKEPKYQQLFNAICFFLEKDYERAFQLLNNQESLEVSNPFLYTFRAFINSQLGLRAMVVKDVAMSNHIILSKSDKLNSTDLRYFIFNMYLLNYVGKYSEAIKYLDTRINSNPNTALFLERGKSHCLGSLENGSLIKRF